MNSRTELNQTAVEVLVDMVELSDKFLNDQDKHNLHGIEEIVDKRKKILSRFENPVSAGFASKSRIDEVRKILQRSKEQDKAMEAIVRKLQKDIVESLNRMKKNIKSLNGYKSKMTKTPRFIDKMR